MSLLLHRGAQTIDYDELKDIPLPKETSSYKPVAHHVLSDKLKDMTLDLIPEFTHYQSQFGVSREGQKLFGLHTFQNGDHQLGFSVGFRNSYDRSLSVAVALGAQVFVCDNLMLTGDLSVMRKHTLNVMDDLENLILSALYRSKTTYRQIGEDSEQMKEFPVSDDKAYQTLGLAYGRGIISPRQIPVVKSEWLNPSHDAFETRSAWSLYNSFTEALKTSPPGSVMERYLKLHDLFKQVAYVRAT